ncbi:hypothetical protein [Vallicoccus soli]|uniref:hypothetical protein n=1 Tax=Vallicoccus soli TaxID=2339232 RepID=UPI001402E364|nr:hypothetical protein [Vallicoccus soli]
MTTATTRTRARAAGRRERLLRHRCGACRSLWTLQVDLRGGVPLVRCTACGAQRGRGAA